VVGRRALRGPVKLAYATEASAKTIYNYHKDDSWLCGAVGPGSDVNKTISLKTKTKTTIGKTKTKTKTTESKTKTKTKTEEAKTKTKTKTTESKTKTKTKTKVGKSNTKNKTNVIAADNVIINGKVAIIVSLYSTIFCMFSLFFSITFLRYMHVR